MSKILVIPDIHLKPEIFDKAEQIMNLAKVDNVVFLGDLVDNWNQENNIDLYKQTINRAIKFKEDYPNSLYCWGNHEIGYFAQWNCSGNSKLYALEIKSLLSEYERKVEPKYIHVVDEVLFSHGGIEKSTAEVISSFGKFKHAYELADNLNQMSIETLGDYISPIWLRPQFSEYYTRYTQVVGHSPVRQPLYIMNTWFLDLFSTTSQGNNCSKLLYMSIIDTINYEISFFDCKNKPKFVTTVNRLNWNTYNGEKDL